MLVPLQIASSEPGAPERTTGLWHENKQVAELKQPLWCIVACNAWRSCSLLMVIIIHLGALRWVDCRPAVSAGPCY